jgi:ferredoxin
MFAPLETFAVFDDAFAVIVGLSTITFRLTRKRRANVICYNLWAQPRCLRRVRQKMGNTYRAAKRASEGRIAMSGKLKIHVDQDKCQGHARCKSLAPELFNLDEFGNAHEVGDGSVPAGLEDKAWLAKANCPEIAIEVTEE